MNKIFIRKKQEGENKKRMKGIRRKLKKLKLKLKQQQRQLRLKELKRRY